MNKADTSPALQASYADIMQLVHDDFLVMDEQVFASLDSKVQLIMKVSEHVISAGGKRMRPLMTLLCAHLLNTCAPVGPQFLQNAIHLGAITEMLHTATLVHDDVVDESTLRRGRPTANATWDNKTAVLVGDYLIARVFNLLVGFKNMPLLQLFSDGTCAIAEGEVLQLAHQHNISTTQSEYFQIIDGKTSRLFVMATVGASLLHGKLHGENLHTKHLQQFGQHFGNAFQIIDDVLDFQGDSTVMGKNIGDDLAEGKPTLPIIKTLQILDAQNSSQYDVLRLAVQTGKINDAQFLIDLVQQTGALDECVNIAKQQAFLAQKALAKLPDNAYRTALINLTKLTLERLA